MACACPFPVICIVAILGNILVVGLQIVSATTKAWVHAKLEKTTFSFGLFSLEDSAGLTTIKMVKQTPLVVMQAMLVFSIGFGCACIVTTLLGMTQKEMCGRSTKFFITLSQIFEVISVILYLIGLATFTHSWMKDAGKFFAKSVPKNATFSYGYAYSISWIIFVIQLALATYLIICVNVMVRRQDKRLAEKDSREEHRKLIDTPMPAVVEKAVVETDKPSSSIEAEPRVDEISEPKATEASN